MKDDAYAFLAGAEATHWWFRARREHLHAIIHRLALPSTCTILDAGCGSGGNLAMLASVGTVEAFEYDTAMRARAQARGIGTVDYGALPHDIPFRPHRYDLITLLDVLEHLEEPVASLAALHERLAPGGALVISVPAYQWLWGPHDERHEHKRRYTATRLRAELREAGLTVTHMTYANTLLFPLAVVQRLLSKIRPPTDLETEPPRALNALLYHVWRAERLWIPRASAPFGLSLFAVAERAQ